MEWAQAFGSLLSMVFGIYGLGLKPRTETGQLTRQGKVILTGIVLSGLVTFSSTAWQTYSRQASAERERARFTRLLESVERTTYASKDGFFHLLYRRFTG
jgi:hypothetical protein